MNLFDIPHDGEFRFSLVLVRQDVLAFYRLAEKGSQILRFDPGVARLYAITGIPATANRIISLVKPRSGISALFIREFFV